MYVCAYARAKGEHRDDWPEEEEPWHEDKVQDGNGDGEDRRPPYRAEASDGSLHALGSREHHHVHVGQRRWARRVEDRQRHWSRLGS